MGWNQTGASSRDCIASREPEGDELAWVAAAKTDPHKFGPLYERYLDQVYH